MSLARWHRQQPGVTVALVNPLQTHKRQDVDDHPHRNTTPRMPGLWRGPWPMGATPREGVWSEQAVLAVTRRQQTADVMQWARRAASTLDARDLTLAVRHVGVSARGGGDRTTRDLPSSCGPQTDGSAGDRLRRVGNLGGYRHPHPAVRMSGLTVVADASGTYQGKSPLGEAWTAVWLLGCMLLSRRLGLFSSSRATRGSARRIPFPSAAHQRTGPSFSQRDSGQNP